MCVIVFGMMIPKKTSALAAFMYKPSDFVVLHVKHDQLTMLACVSLPTCVMHVVPLLQLCVVKAAAHAAYSVM